MDKGALLDLILGHHASQLLYLGLKDNLCLEFMPLFILFLIPNVDSVCIARTLSENVNIPWVKMMLGNEFRACGKKKTVCM